MTQEKDTNSVIYVVNFEKVRFVKYFESSTLMRELEDLHSFHA